MARLELPTEALVARRAINARVDRRSLWGPNGRLAASLPAVARELGGSLSDQILFGQEVPASTAALSRAPDSPRCLELAQQHQDLIAVAIGLFSQLRGGEAIMLSQNPFQNSGRHNAGRVRPDDFPPVLSPSYIRRVGRRRGGLRGGPIGELLSGGPETGDLGLRLVKSLIDCCD
jgi:hypothetical protein